MAFASQKKTTFLSQKLTFLKDLGDQLNRAVGLYANGIIEAGESWTEGGDNKNEYMELCKMIDTAVVFLCEKCEEMAGASVGTAANQLSQPSCEQPQTTSQPITATASTSYRQHTGLLTSTPTTSHILATEPVQPADETQLKTFLARIVIIEEVLSSSRSNVDKVAEQQSCIDQQLKELLSKLSESDKKHTTRLRKVNEQISEIIDTQFTLDQEQETRLQSLEKQLEKLSTAQDRMEVEMESQAELTQKLVHVPDQLESVKENLDVLDARIGRIMEDCSNKHQDIEHVTRDLADKVKANTDTVRVISEGQDQKTTLLGDLETRLQALEADSERNVKHVQKQAEKGQTNLRMLCQMLNDRLTPLEQLRTSLNQRASTRDENIKKLSQVIQEVAVMSPRLQQLEWKSSTLGHGFSVYKSTTDEVIEDTIQNYTIQFSNVGGAYNEDSGIFTAPIGGLYVVSISLWLQEDGVVEVRVNHKQGVSDISGSSVCSSSVVINNTTASDLALVSMKAGDTLFTSMSQMDGDYEEITLYFSCFHLA